MAADAAARATASDDPPLASDDEEDGSDEDRDAKPAAPPPSPIKVSTMVYMFLFLLGILMIFDNSTRNQVATLIGVALAPLIGFGGHYILLTMFLAAAIEMLLTAFANNATTDWVKAAKVQSWSAAFRKVQMAALKSGKKDRIAALQPHQQELTRLSSEVSLSQLKGMAVTWFLVIAIYTWVGLYLQQLSRYSASHNLSPALNVVNLGGAQVNLLGPLWIVPVWFLLFSLYTVPLSLTFRRVLKHYSLRRASATLPPAPAIASGGAGGPA